MTRTLEVYNTDTIKHHLADHPDWSLGDDGMLHAAYTFKNFMQAMMFVNAVALLAETADHHPDLRVHGYKNVAISVMTHDHEGITDLDFALIAQIDALPRFE